MSGTHSTGATPDGFRPEQVAEFRYVDADFDRARGRLRCRYALDDVAFEELVTFEGTGARRDADGLDVAIRLVFLLAGISYYKAAAPSRVAVPSGLQPTERALLEAFYLDGLGEFAFRNGLDLRGLTFDAPHREPAGPFEVSLAPASQRPLIPFGGGIDSIVTVEGVRPNATDAALFVVSREGDRFDAIEAAAAVTGLPVVRAGRRLDDKVLRSRELGFRNGHIPVTGVLSAIAVMAAVLDGRDAVVMSNEWSAGSGNVEHHGRVVNHQWSKSLEFEDLFRATLAAGLPQPVEYFSWLRPFSELWVARRFADLHRYHPVFRSCNRAFHVDRAARLDHWCGHCPKCCFVDLVLAPFMSAAQLGAVFDGVDPLDQPPALDGSGVVGELRTLVGLSGEIKPFECVGDVDECRVAALLTGARDDRRVSSIVQTLATELRPIVGDRPDAALARLLQPLGPHRIPARYAPSDLLG